MNWNKNNRIIAFFVFIVSFIVYALTVSPTASYWDCGEFIACSYTLAVPHPPGAPLYLLIGRIFSMIPFVQDIALRVNFISVLSSALTIMLLYLSIVHLIREWKGTLKSTADWQIAIFSGILGSFTFAFTHSFWFNAVEAEVYALSMLCTALLVWLILVWAERSDQPGNERYLLMIAYLNGLAIGIHLLNVLALPFVTLIIFYKKFEFSKKNFLTTIGITIGIILLIYPGIVKYLPRIALEFGVIGLILFFIILIWIALWAFNNNKKMVSLISISILLIIIGYSTYTMIYIRSNLDPMIDENNPETVHKLVDYLEREQYGEHSIIDRPKVWKESPNGRRYASAWEFFWKYQVDKMYIRYFMWQFVGLSENEEDIDPKQFYYIPLLLGLLGMYWQFKNDYKNGLAVLSLFFMTGLAIVLYLNQPDPQPRERDYSYVGSFFAFSIWIGLGYAGIIDLLTAKRNEQNREFQSKMIRLVIFIILFIITPIHMIARNYDSHDRSGNYVAWDYSYNMLQSCEPGGIIFTNGDNDTFPLWYLQEVEKVRTDVRVVNLSLLNTGWYIKQLRDLEPKVPIASNDYQLENQLGVIRWEKQKCILKVPPQIGKEYSNELQKRFEHLSIDVPNEIMFEVRPTMTIPNGPSLLRVQDWMILNILAVNKWKKPVYFAVTVAKDNMLSDLQQYLRMDGLVLKIVPFKNWEISPDNLEKNLVHIYQYRGLQDSRVYYDRNIQGLLQNYRSAFLQLIEYNVRIKEMSKVKQLLEDMERKLPSSVIPWTNKYLKIIRDSYLLAIDLAKLDSMIVMYSNEQELVLLGENLYRLDLLEASEKIFAYIYNVNPSNVHALSILINIYEVTRNYINAIKYLENHLNINPNDTVAKEKLETLKRQVKG
jgi:hypothetical protein